MPISRHHWLEPFCIALLLLLPASSAWSEVDLHPDNASDYQYPAFVQRYYANTSRYLISHYGIILKGSPQHIARISGWLDQIYAVPYGRDTLEAILASGNVLTIRSSDWALQASGRTLAPATDNLINGKGEDVEILFDARIPDAGSHRVYGHDNQLIEFTAVQNLYHELAHAKHLTNGTWRYSNSEGQAIEEENRFRKQLGKMQGNVAVSYRTGIRGVQFWQPK